MERRTRYESRKFHVVTDTRQRSGRTIERDVVVHPGAVAVLPILDENHIVLLRNFRVAVEETLWEIPAGTLEPGEDPAITAKRELTEETGYTAKTWEPFLETYPSPGILSEKMYFFAARELTLGESCPEEDEELEPAIVSWSDALDWVESNKIRDAKTIVALLWWLRFRTP